MITESQIDAHVAAIFRDIEFTREPAGLYDPLRYMIEIGGKHLRPRLCLTTYSFFDDSFGDEILSPAAALEVFHSFTLMHDDIMDRSPLRRGMPTVWKKWNESTAILSGDVMLIDAFQRIAKAQPGAPQKAPAFLQQGQHPAAQQAAHADRRRRKGPGSRRAHLLGRHQGRQQRPAAGRGGGAQRKGGQNGYG